VEAEKKVRITLINQKEGMPARCPFFVLKIARR
jgi:hypothetical protein